MKGYQIRNKEEIEEIYIDEPEVNSEEVLIRIEYLGLCGSDLKTFKGENPLVEFPIIPGHEISGEILSTGDNVPETFKSGQIVTIIPYAGCGKCIACKKGRTNCCKFNKTLGIAQPGAAVEKISIHYSRVIPVEDFKKEEIIFIEPFSIGYHAAKRSEIGKNKKVIVFGCGLIGLGVIFAAAHLGGDVIAIDIDDSKLEIAEKFGAKYLYNSKNTDIGDRIKEITNDSGVEVAIEAVGNPVTYKACIDSVCFSGVVTYIGYSNKETSILMKDIIYKEIDLRGSRNATIQDMYETVAMIKNSDIDLRILISKMYPINRMQDAFEYWDNNREKTTKIVLKQV